MRRKVDDVKVPLSFVVCLRLGFLACLGLLWVGSATRQTGAMNKPRTLLSPNVEVLAEPGDIVARRGTGLHSQAVLMADGTSRFSHVGIVAKDDWGRKLVVHSLPPSAGHSGGVRKDSISTFLSNEVAVEWAFFRLADVKSGQTAERAAHLAKALGSIDFDDKFDHSDSRKLYCTELVWFVYLQAGVDLTDGKLDEIKWPLLEPASVILPSRILASRRLIRIY